MRHIKVFGMKIYFEGLGIAYVKYISNIFWRIYLIFIKKIYVKYILILQLFAKIYFIYFAYIFFYVGATI